MALHSEFESLGLKEDLLRGIFAYGFSTPSEIQRDAIPSISAGESAVVQSKNGTGKTATFLLGLLQRVNPQKKGVQAIVISPTRDLAIQTYNVFTGLSQFLRINGHCAIGQEKKLTADITALATCTVLFGTPGRILHLVKESFKSFSSLRMVVLDEADSALESGFGVPVKSLFEKIKPLSPQLVFVSATIPKELTELLASFIENPRMFLVPQQKLALSGISQFYIKVTDKKKFNALCNIFSRVSVSQAVIFANKKETVVQIGRQLQIHEFPAVILHGSLEQTERNKRMGDFFNGKYRILVSTDVTARGIDAAHVNLVINYDIPYSSDEYLHRIGRGGRFGKTSIAVSLIEPEEYERSQSTFGAYGRTLQEFVLEK